MAGLQATGVGSGLDINSLVSQLVASERAPADAQITRKESKATLQISALAALKGALSTFQSSLTPLKTVDAFTPHTATTGNKDIFTVSAKASAAPGSYDIEVVDLAQAHQLASNAFAGGDTSVVGTGSLTIAMGASTFNVNIDDTNNTLAGIRDAINAAPGNTDVRATIIREQNGSRLILASAKTGVANAIKVTQSGGDGGLNQLVYDPGVTTNLTQLKAAQDAHILIAGFDHYAATNTVDTAIDGVTLNLLATSAGEPVQVSVTNDDKTLTDRVKKFVAEYNALYSTMAKLRSYNPDTKAAGALLGDSMLRGIEEEIRTDLSNPVAGLSGNYTSLASIGVTRQADGTLALDDAKLTSALTADRSAVANIFGSENGIAARMHAHIEARLGEDGALESRDNALQATIKAITLDKENLEARMVNVQARYLKQFTALDTLLAQLQNTSSYLTQQLASLPGAAR